MNDLKNLSEASVLTDELVLISNDGNEYDTGNLSGAKKHFSKTCIGILAICVLILPIGFLFECLMKIVCPQVLEWSLGMWLIDYALYYFITVPIGLLILRKVPVQPLEKRNLKPSRYMIMISICFFLGEVGNIIGIAIFKLLKLLTGVSIVDPSSGYNPDIGFIPTVLIVAIIAPVFEEYVFRKLLIDRIHIYGQKLAVITSALMFGLIHGNPRQFLYAFTVGLGLGYIYLKTGKLRYSIGVHMLINLIAGIIESMFLEKVTAVGAVKNLEKSWLIGWYFYWFVLIGIIITGLILLCINKSKISFESSQMELPKKSRFKTVYMNVGMILFIVYCIFMIVTSIMSML